MGSNSEAFLDMWCTLMFDINAPSAHTHTYTGVEASAERRRTSNVLESCKVCSHTHTLYLV